MSGELLAVYTDFTRLTTLMKQVCLFFFFAKTQTDLRLQVSPLAKRGKFTVFPFNSHLPRILYLLRGDENVYRSQLSVAHFLNAGLLNPWATSHVCIQILFCEECRERGWHQPIPSSPFKGFPRWIERRETNERG